MVTTDPSRVTVPELLRARAQLTPRALALSARSHRGVREELTYRDLFRRVEGFGAVLARLGVAHGDRLALFLTNDAGLECVVTAIGAMAIGCAAVPLNTRYADEELRHALQLTEPAAIVTLAPHATRLAALRPGLRFILLDDPSAPDGADREHAANPPSPPSPDDLACLLFTSGTTARAKAVMHSHRTMIAAGTCCAAALGLTPADRYQATFPFFTSSALNLACMACWVSGAAFVYEEVLDSAGRLSLVASQGTTYYHGVPSVLSFMLQAREAGLCEPRSLRRIAYGGAPMPPDVADRLAQAWPWAEQVQIYGMTESGPTGTVLGPHERAARVGSVGRPMPGCSIAILDEAGQEQERGRAGEIVIESPAVALGYFRDPASTEAAFDGKRIRTGDMGHLDADGFLFFGDRKKDVINRGGLKIASVAVESVIARLPAVHEVAVVAAPHPDLGEDVAAFVVLRAGERPDPAALARSCGGKLADYEVPHRWIFVDELPKNPMGKVIKSELRRRLSAK